MKYIALTIYLILLIILLNSCASNLPKNPHPWMELIGQNDCLPTAISFKEALAKSCKWDHVIVYQYNNAYANNRPEGHAIVAYMYPIGKNQLWTYDYMGSYRIRAYLDDPIVIAQLAEIQRGRPLNKVTSAEFIDK